MTRMQPLDIAAINDTHVNILYVIQIRIALSVCKNNTISVTVGTVLSVTIADIRQLVSKSVTVGTVLIVTFFMFRRMKN